MPAANSSALRSVENSPMDAFASEEACAAMAVEDRPSGDFIDGFLAGLASASASLDPSPDARYYFSFDWIGDGEEERAQALEAAFQTEPGDLEFEITAVLDWRVEAETVGARWLAHRLPEAAATGMVAELVELLGAFFGPDPIDAFRVAPRAKSDGAAPAPGGDHLLFETPEGRLLLEFSIET